MKVSPRELTSLVARISLAILPAAMPMIASAQSSVRQPEAHDPAPQRISVFGARDAASAAAFVLGSLAIMPLDRHIAAESQRPSLQNDAVLGHTTTAFRLLGEPGSIVIAGATYIYGRADDSPRSAELGLRTIESIGAAGITSLLIKGMAGRARPFVSDTNPHDYKLGRGFRHDDYASFPSGHVTTAFAAASTASQEISYLWPHASHLWTPVLFTSASFVGVARIYENKHWASDVVAGAAVGTVVSRIVVHYARAHPRNFIDSGLLPARASEVSGGRIMSFRWNYQW